MISYKTLNIDDDEKMLYLDGEEVLLTPSEYNILKTLLENQNKVLSREELKGDKNIGIRSVDVNITRLRKKIKQYSDNIISRRGFGYIFKTT